MGFEYRTTKGSSFIHRYKWKGVIPGLERRFRESSSEGARRNIALLMNPTPCPDCKGRRLQPASLAVTVDGRNISQWSAVAVAEIGRAHV